MDAANMLKPMLARGELRMIGATTLAEYRKIERDARAGAPLLAGDGRGAVGRGDRRRSCAGCARPTRTTTTPTITDEALTAAARLCDRYVTEYRLPDKAIDLVDQAAARVRLRNAADARRRRAAARARRRSQAEKQAAVDAEAYEEAGELKTRIEELEAQLAELGEPRTSGRPTQRPSSARPRSPRSSPRAPASRSGELVAGELERLQHLEDDLHRRVDRPGRGRRARRRHRPPRPRRPVRGRPPARHVPVPRPDRRRQDRAGQGARRAAVRDREGARAHRHVRVPRAAHGRAADRLAARLRRLRRRRPADRAGAPAPVLGRAARRDREGAPRGLERAARSSWTTAA